MKNRIKILSIFLFLFIVTFTSCKKDNDLVTIIIESDKIQVDAGNFEYFFFTVIGNDGNGYTSESDIYVNNEKLSEPKFFPQDAGSYEVYAQYEGMTSETITVTAVNNLTGIELSEIHNDLTNNNLIFELTDNYGNNVSHLATYFVDDVEVPGTTYKLLTAGTISVYAKYRGFTSNTIDIDIYDATHTTKILVEDYTGAWCVYCPRVAYKLEQAVNNDGNIIPVGVHYDDNMHYLHILQMMSSFDVSGFPTAIVNRAFKWGETEPELTDLLERYVGLGLSVSSVKTSNDIDITVQVHFDLNYNEEIKLVVCLLENGLLQNQRNYYEDLYSGDDPIVNFEHNHVLQKAYTDIFGDVIPSNETVRGNTYQRVFNVTVPSNVSNADNTKLIVYVVKSKNNEVINVQIADINSFQDFD